MLRVALVGHSQLPTNLLIEGTQISIFRAPGGKAISFFEDNRLSSILNWRGDVVIVWLGSNDIEINSNVAEIVNNLIHIKESIEKECGAKVIITLLEPRCYPNDYPVHQTQYAKIQKGVNRKLERKLPQTHFIKVNTPCFQQLLSHDGVHFTFEGRQLIENIIKENIADYLASC